MSKGETGADATGYKRGEKGFARSADDAQFIRPDYKKELLESERPVGQVATVGDGAKLKQRGY